MSITLNGTTGIASVDGSAASPSVRGADSNSGIVYAADEVKISTGGTERAKVNSSGHFLPGAADTYDLGANTTPWRNIWLENDLYIEDNGMAVFGTGEDLKIYHDASNSWIKNTQNTLILASNLLELKNEVGNEAYLKGTNNGSVELYFDNAKKLETQANGILINTDNTSSTTGNGIVFDGSGNTRYKCDGTGAHDFAEFFRGTDGSKTRVGNIRTNGSSTTYTTSSDYRLKENEVAISDGITRLKLLKPYKFNFKVLPDTKVDGFFAHEVTPAVPEAITGEKDGTEMQGIDQSKLVPLLTAALQEAIIKIETLETKVAALEAA